MPVNDDAKKDDDEVEADDCDDDSIEDGIFDEIDHEDTNEEIFEIEGKPGKYKASITIFDKYANRPPCLEKMTPAQFAICYRANNRQKKSTAWELDTDNESMISQERKYFTIFNTDIYLPDRIKLRGNLGQMSCRTRVCVLKYHLSKKKGGYEQFYAEMLLFSSWRNELAELFPYDEVKCLEQYEDRKDEISSVKDLIFPGESAIDLNDGGFFDTDRPTHVFDELDCQGQQQNADDLEEDIEDDLDIAPLQWNGANEREDAEPGSKREGANYRKVPLLKDNELMILTRSLADEQKDALSKVIDVCKSHLKAQSKLHLKTKQLLLLIHGGAGNE